MPSVEPGTIAPLQHMRRVLARYPEATRQIERFRALRDAGQLERWPAWCFCPLAGAYAVVTDAGGPSDDIGDVGAVTAWRPTQSVYRFDPDLADALLDTPLDGELPVDVLERLPEWCVWVDATARTPGFFAFLEHDANTARRELRFECQGDEGLLVPIILHLDAGTIDGAIRSWMREATAQRALQGPWATPLELEGEDMATVRAFVGRLVALVLYLCSDEPDYSPDGSTPVRPPDRPATRLPAAPRVWDVGARIGASLREAAARGDGEGAAHLGPRPHVRRAHWHAYWLGPRDGERRRTLRWLSPILVGGEGVVPVVRGVE